MLASPAPLPAPETYEEEYRYWPWRYLIDFVASWVGANVKPDASVFDHMCGTGYLLEKIRNQRPDIHVSGCDIHLPFVDYSQVKHPGTKVCHADSLQCDLGSSANVLICTGGLHHFEFEAQKNFIAKLSRELGPNAILIVGEEVVGEYDDERSRRIAAMDLNGELIRFGLSNQWPPDQLDAAIEVMKNDILLRGEYKRSVSAWKELLQAQFDIFGQEWTWAAPGNRGGDIIFFCRTKGAV